MSLRLISARFLHSRKIFCDKLWAGLSIRWNGDIEPCACACGDTPIFNVAAAPFLDAWNSEPYRKTRAFLLAGMGRKDVEPVAREDVFDICRNCPVPLVDRFSIVRWRLKGLDLALRLRAMVARAPTDREMLRRKTENYARLIRTLRRPGTTVPCYPVLGNLDASNLCNLRCPMCHAGNQELKHPRGRMSLDTFERVMEEVGPGLIHLELYRYGEPLLNPHVAEMVRIAARKYHCFTRISSNLSMPLSDEAIDELLDSGLETLVVAADGPDQETYERYRRGGNLERVLDNLERIVSRRAERGARGNIIQGARKPRILWQYLVFSHNEKRVEETRRLARRIGVDRFIAIEPSVPMGDAAAGWVSKTRGRRGATDERRKRQVLSARFEPIPTASQPRQGHPDSTPAAVPCFPPSLSFELVAHVRNTTRETWPADHGENGSVRLGVKLFRNSRDCFLYELGRGFLSQDLGPGDEREIRAIFQVPEEPGHYHLKLDMVVEGETWHEWKTGEKSWPFWMEFEVSSAMSAGEKKKAPME